MVKRKRDNDDIITCFYNDFIDDVNNQINSQNNNSESIEEIKNLQKDITNKIKNLNDIMKNLNELKLKLKKNRENLCDHEIYSVCEYHNDRYYYCKKCSYSY